MTNDEQRVSEMILSQLEGAFERWYSGDPFGYLALMSEEMTYFSPFLNKRLDGKQAVAAVIEPIEGQIQVPNYDIRDPSLQLGDNIAVFTFHLDELDEDGELMTGWKVTEVYRQVGEKWRIIHAHYSSLVESS